MPSHAEDAKLVVWSRTPCWQVSASGLLSRTPCWQVSASVFACVPVRVCVCAVDVSAPVSCIRVGPGSLRTAAMTSSSNAVGGAGEHASGAIGGATEHASGRIAMASDPQKMTLERCNCNAGSAW